MNSKIYLDAPNVGELEKAYLNRAIDEGYVSVVGPYVSEFEKRFAQYLNIESAVATQSGTSAIHAALHELNINQGDEVIVPALTFVATVNPVIYRGAQPVFVDVDIETWDILPEAIEKSITDKTKAIIPVHLYGNPCAMDKILNIAERYGLYVVEDATESLGAKYKGAHTGTFGDMGCFSFNGNKMVVTGGGGMIVGKDSKMLEHISFLVNQAKDKSNEQFHSEVGFNYRMTNIEAALGLAQMQRLETLLAKKRKFADIYRKELETIKFIRFQKEYDNAQSSWWLPVVIFEKEIDIVGLQANLKAKGVPTRKVFIPVTEFPPYQCYKKTKLSNSYYIYNKGLCLPASTLNREDDIYYICQTIKELVG